MALLLQSLKIPHCEVCMPVGKALAMTSTCSTWACAHLWDPLKESIATEEHAEVVVKSSCDLSHILEVRPLHSTGEDVIPGSFTGVWCHAFELLRQHGSESCNAAVLNRTFCIASWWKPSIQEMCLLRTGPRP